MCESVFLLVGEDGKAVACIQGEVETACIYCKPKDRLFCPLEHYSGDPDNPSLIQHIQFEVRRTECQGA